MLSNKDGSTIIPTPAKICILYERRPTLMYPALLIWSAVIFSAKTLMVNANISVMQSKRLP